MTTDQIDRDMESIIRQMGQQLYLLVTFGQQATEPLDRAIDELDRYKLTPDGERTVDSERD